MYYDDDLNRKWLQAEFLAVVGEVIPDVCRDLYDEPFRLYKEITPLAPIEWERLQSFDTPQTKSLCNSVEAWANRWNLTAEWCKDAALSILNDWSRSSVPVAAFPHPSGEPFTMPERYPPPVLPTYEHEFGRKRYLDDVRKVVGQIEKYCTDVESDHRHFTQKDKRNLSEHFEWTVKFQVLGEPFERIAGDSVTGKAVSKAVREILGVIELDERPGVKRGRPKGSRTIHRAHNPRR